MQEALEMTEEEMDRAAHRILMQENVEGVRILSFADLQKALEEESAGAMDNHFEPIEIEPPGEEFNDNAAGDEEEVEKEEVYSEVDEAPEELENEQEDIGEEDEENVEAEEEDEIGEDALP